MRNEFYVKYFLLFFSIFVCSICLAQDESTAMRDTSSIQTPSELLSRFTVGTGLGNEAMSVPKVAIKTFKFSALIGKGEWDFNLTNSVPAFSVDQSQGEQYMRNDLVRQLGGVLNFSLGRNGYFANGKNKNLEEIKGARFEFRMGGKLVDVLDQADEVAAKRDFVPVLQSTMDFGFMIPLFAHKSKNDKSERKKEDMVGNLSFRFIGGLMYVSSTKVYDYYYISRKGVPPNPTIAAGTFDVFFYISNKVYINFGYTMSNQPQIKPIPYLSISYGKQN